MYVVAGVLRMLYFEVWSVFCEVYFEEFPTNWGLFDMASSDKVFGALNVAVKIRF